MLQIKLPWGRSRVFTDNRVTAVGIVKIPMVNGATTPPNDTNPTNPTRKSRLTAPSAPSPRGTESIFCLLRTLNLIIQQLIWSSWENTA